MKVSEQIELIKHSRCFDEAWYLSEYPDVKSIRMCPVTHYVRYGWRVGRNPSPTFNTRFYLKHYPDVARSGLNPLVHYVKFGQDEGRDTGPCSRSPLFTAQAITAAEPSPLIAPAATEVPKDEKERLSGQLAHTQQLLEHYYQRSRELEFLLQGL